MREVVDVGKSDKVLDDVKIEDAEKECVGKLKVLDIKAVCIPHTHQLIFLPSVLRTYEYKIHAQKSVHSIPTIP
jgi:hypothetical protein